MWAKCGLEAEIKTTNLLINSGYDFDYAEIKKVVIFLV